MKNILIRVREKVASYIDGGPIVCGNPFSITFDLDEEWAGHELLTARLVWAGADGVLQYAEKVFNGNTVDAPILANVSQVYVGLYVGGLCTSTPALVPCQRSIQCLGGVTPDPAPDVYAQIIEMIQNGMLVGPPGPQGEKGDAGAIKFIPVVELPTENIDDAAIYLVPIADGGEENRFTEYAYIDGKWEVIGAITVQVDHSEYVKFTDYMNGTTAGVAKINSNNSGLHVQDGFLQLYPCSPVALTLRNQTGVNYNIRNPIVAGNLNIAVIASLTDDKKIIMTDEEKAIACETLGAVQRQPIKDNGWNRAYGMTSTGEECVFRVANGIQANTIAIRGANGEVKCGAPLKDDDATNKDYVDNLPNYLTNMTAEQKAKWKAFLESILN